MRAQAVYVKGLTCRVAVQLSSLYLTLVHGRAVRGIAGDEGSVTETLQLTVLHVPLITRLEGRGRGGGLCSSRSGLILSEQVYYALEVLGSRPARAVALSPFSLISLRNLPTQTMALITDTYTLLPRSTLR